MSHEFIITTVAPNKKADPLDQLKAMRKQPHGHFQGNWDGALYKVFKATKFDAGPSGCFDGKTVSKAEAVTALDAAFKMLESYPDKNRVTSLRDFYSKTLLPSPDASTFYVHFY